MRHQDDGLNETETVRRPFLWFFDSIGKTWRCSCFQSMLHHQTDAMKAAGIDSLRAAGQKRDAAGAALDGRWEKKWQFSILICWMKMDFCLGFLYTLLILVDRPPKTSGWCPRLPAAVCWSGCVTEMIRIRWIKKEEKAKQSKGWRKQPSKWMAAGGLETNPPELAAAETWRWP